MGWKQWTRERMALADAQMLTDQGVLSFPSASALNSAIPQSKRTEGMVSFVADTRAYWSWNVVDQRWEVFGQTERGGAQALTMLGGFIPQAGRRPQVRRLGVDRAMLSGWFVNNAIAYTPNSAIVPFQLPAGFVPVQDQVIPMAVLGRGMGLLTLRAAGSTNGGKGNFESMQPGASVAGDIPVNTNHLLDGIVYDLTYSGA